MKSILIWLFIILLLIIITIGIRYLAEFHSMVYWIIAITLIVIYPFSLDYPKNKVKHNKSTL